jgi:hypothetical protein
MRSDSKKGAEKRDALVRVHSSSTGIGSAFSAGSGFSGVFSKVRGVLTDYRDFFESSGSRVGLGYSVLYFLGIVAVYLAIVSVVYVFTYDSGVQVAPLWESVLVAVFVGMLFSVVFLFVLSGFVYLLARLLKGSGNFVDTVAITSFSSTPAYLLGWVPLLGILAIAYSVVIQIKGVEVKHKLSSLKSVVCVLVPFAVLVLVAFFGMLWLGVFDSILAGGSGASSSVADAASGVAAEVSAGSFVE